MGNGQMVKLAFIPTRRRMYDVKYALDNRNAILQRIRQILPDHVEIIDLDWLNEEGMLIDLQDVPSVERHLREKGADAIFLPHCNFGSEEIVGKLGKLMNLPVLLWGPRDQRPPEDLAVRQTDVQCGLFASSKSLQRYGVPFTYIENCWIMDDAFTVGFEAFIRTAAVVKAFRHMRIGQISSRPKPFLSVMINESELLEKFGVEVVPVTSGEVVQKVEKILRDKPEAWTIIHEDIRKELDWHTMQPEQLEKMAALELAFLQVAEENQCNVLASECWRVFYQALGIRTCFVFGDTTDRGLIVACETDVHGALTSALLSAAALGEKKTFLADLTIRHPDNDQAELLWHCGPFPKSLAKDAGNRQLLDFKGYWELEHGDVTIARFDGLGGQYSLLACEGRGVDGPSTNGNYLWFETQDWPRWEKAFIQGPYIHHVAGIHGHYAEILTEACRYLPGVKIDLG